MFWMKEQQVQGGKYIIKGVLGIGGYGITYKALHTYLDTYVAIKTINKTINSLGEAEYQKYLSGFRKEGKTLEKLSKKFHPNIVRIRDFFEEDGFPCLVMDFVEGESLMQLVQRKRHLPIQDVVYYIRQISEALVTVHNAGLIHRDVQPCNVLIQKDETAILIDFGISKSQISSTQSSLTVSGHLIYAPEEQFRDDRRPTVDIFALAGSLYYGITGEPPENCFDRRVLEKELIPPKQLVPELSEHLNQAIVRALSLNPKDRPQSIQEWISLLDSRATSNSIEAMPPKAIELGVTVEASDKEAESTETLVSQIFVSNTKASESENSQSIQSSTFSIDKEELEGEISTEEVLKISDQNISKKENSVTPSSISSVTSAIGIFLCCGVESLYMSSMSAPLWLWCCLLGMSILGIVLLVFDPSRFEPHPGVSFAGYEIEMKWIGWIHRFVSFFAKPSWIIWLVTADVWEILHLTNGFAITSFAALAIQFITFLVILAGELFLTGIAGVGVTSFAISAGKAFDPISVSVLITFIALAGLASGWKLIH